MDRVVATAAHEIPDRPPLRLRVGDRVTLGERDVEWPAFVFVTAPQESGWLWCRSDGGREGWVPIGAVAPA